jgi:hypothetical protein
VNAKLPTGVPPKEREKVVDAPLDVPDAALKPLGASSDPADYVASDLDTAELELLPPRRRAALLRYFRSPASASTQPTH